MKNVIRITTENTSYKTQTRVWFYWNVLTLVWGNATVLQLDPGSSNTALSLHQLFHPLFFPNSMTFSILVNTVMSLKGNKSETKLPVLLEALCKILKVKVLPSLIKGQKLNHMNITCLLGCIGASLVAQLVKNLPAMRETWVWLIPGLERSPGEGKGYPLQYSGLENSMDYRVGHDWVTFT